MTKSQETLALEEYNSNYAADQTVTTDYNMMDEFNALKNLLLLKQEQNPSLKLPRDLCKFVKGCILASPYINERDGISTKTLSVSDAKILCDETGSSIQGSDRLVLKRVHVKFLQNINQLKQLLGQQSFQVWKQQSQQQQGDLAEVGKLLLNDASVLKEYDEQEEHLENLTDTETQAEQVEICKKVDNKRKNKEDSAFQKRERRLFGDFSENEDLSVGVRAQFSDPLFRDPANFMEQQQPPTTTLQLPSIQNIHTEHAASPLSLSPRWKRKLSDLKSYSAGYQKEQVVGKRMKFSLKNNPKFTSEQITRIKQMLENNTENNQHFFTTMKKYNEKLAEQLYFDLGDVLSEAVYCDIHKTFKWSNDDQSFSCPQCVFQCKYIRKLIYKLDIQNDKFYEQIERAQKKIQNSSLQIEKNKIKIQKIVQESNQEIKNQKVREQKIQKEFQNECQQFLKQYSELQEKHGQKLQNFQKQIELVQDDLEQLEEDKNQDIKMVSDLEVSLEEIQKEIEEKWEQVLVMEREYYFELD